MIVYFGCKQSPVAKSKNYTSILLAKEEECAIGIANKETPLVVLSLPRHSSGIFRCVMPKLVAANLEPIFSIGLYSKKTDLDEYGRLRSEGTTRSAGNISHGDLGWDPGPSKHSNCGLCLVGNFRQSSTANGRDSDSDVGMSVCRTH